MESLNTRANGLMTAEVAMRQAAEEGRLAATEGIEISQRVTAETKRLSKLIKDRSASIKELEKLERKTPGYISGTVKRRYNRYNKQLEGYRLLGLLTTRINNELAVLLLSLSHCLVLVCLVLIRL
jgi:hypothetical protein